MQRPTKGGLLIAVALSIPVLIELRTLLVWIGLDVPIGVYVPAAVALVGLLAGAVWVLGDEGEPGRV